MASAGGAQSPAGPPMLALPPAPPQVPRPSGVRRGWQRVFAALSDSRLLLFDAPDPRLSPASGALLQALDLRWVPGRGEGLQRWGEAARGPVTSDQLHGPLQGPPVLSHPRPGL